MTRRAAVLGSAAAILLTGTGVCLLFYSNFWHLSKSSIVPAIPPARERQAVRVPSVRFTDVTAAAGISFRHFNGATGKKLLPETMGAGVAAFDFDGDGLQDLLFVDSCPWPGSPIPHPVPHLVLYRNRGNGTFEDVTSQVGLDVFFLRHGRGSRRHRQ